MYIAHSSCAGNTLFVSYQLQYYVPHADHLLLEMPLAEVVDDVEEYLGAAVVDEREEVVAHARAQLGGEDALGPVLLLAGAVVLLEEEAEAQLADVQAQADCVPVHDLREALVLRAEQGAEDVDLGDGARLREVGEEGVDVGQQARLLQVEGEVADLRQARVAEERLEERDVYCGVIWSQARRAGAGAGVPLAESMQCRAERPRACARNSESSR